MIMQIQTRRPACRLAVPYPSRAAWVDLQLCMGDEEDLPIQCVPAVRLRVQVSAWKVSTIDT